MSSNKLGAGKDQQHEEKQKFSERLNEILRANRVAFLAISALIVVAVAVIGVVAMVQQDRLVKSTIALEALEASFDGWASSSEESRPAASVALIAEADTLIAKYSRDYAGLRARLIKGRAFVGANDYLGAEQAFASVAEAGPKSHLAPMALANASAMAEERGDLQAALGYLTKAQASYPASPGADRVGFSIGRIQESLKDYAKAMEAYSALVAGGADNDWTKLARDRIIYLRSVGLDK
jgi:tetratricopeptide (TPR) repeat protein